MELLLFIVLAASVAIIVWSIRAYNFLQHSMQDAREGYSNIQVTLKRKSELLKQILEIAAGYGDHERLVHNVAGRSFEKSSVTITQFEQKYPDLKADSVYKKLMDQLETVEHSVEEKRQRYNSMVNRYNSSRNAFPTVLIANKFGFVALPYFDVSDPDSLEHIKIFRRDDTEVLLNALNDSGKLISDSVSSIASKTSGSLGRLADTKNPRENRKLPSRFRSSRK
jgi:LemA protein